MNNIEILAAFIGATQGIPAFIESNYTRMSKKAVQRNSFRCNLSIE